MQGHPPPRREAGQGTAPTISSRPTGGGGLGTDFDLEGGLIAFGGNNTEGAIDVATAVNAHGGPSGRLDFETETFIAEPYTLAVRGRGDGHDLEYRRDGTANAVLTPSGGRAGIGVGAIAFDWYASRSQSMPIGEHAPPIKTTMQPAVVIPLDTTQITSQANGSNPQPGDPMHALSARAHPPAVAGTAIRRLMPHECARLQGFPDDRCRISWRGKPAPDGPQYKAYGNSMAVPVMRWIGQRIDLMERLVREGRIP